MSSEDDDDIRTTPTASGELSAKLIKAVRENAERPLRGRSAEHPEQRGSSPSYSGRRRKNTSLTMYSERMRGRRVANTTFLQFCTVFILGFVLAVSIGARKFDWLFPSTSTPGTGYSESFFTPLFGPSAVMSCQLDCSSWTGNEFAECREACNRFSFDVYGRRITDRPLSPAADAEAVMRGCGQFFAPRGRLRSEQLWSERSRSFTELLKKETASGGDLARRYWALIQAGELLSLPPESLAALDRDTRELLYIGCLRVQYLLSEMALASAKLNGDSFSARFFGELRDNLKLPSDSALKTLKLLRTPADRTGDDV